MTQSSEINGALMHFVQNLTNTRIYFETVVFKLCNDSCLQFITWLCIMAKINFDTVVFIHHLVLFLQYLGIQNIWVLCLSST